MDEPIRFDHVVVGFSGDVPIITEWFCHEIERWILTTRNQEVSVEITFSEKNEKNG